MSESEKQTNELQFVKLRKASRKQRANKRKRRRRKRAEDEANRRTKVKIAK